MITKDFEPLINGLHKIIERRKFIGIEELYFDTHEESFAFAQEVRSEGFNACIPQSEPNTVIVTDGANLGRTLQLA